MTKLGEFKVCLALGALIVGLWAPDARAQLGMLDIDPPGPDEPCAVYVDDDAPSAGGTRGERLRAAEVACLDYINGLLADVDDSTEWFSATSVVGALGVVASGLTGQGVGTLNAWLGVGLSPVIADDIRQRPQVERILVDVRQNLMQMRCRAVFLESHYYQLNWQQDDLDRQARELLALLVERVDARPNLMSATTGRDANLRLIVEEGFRVVGEARRLSRRINFIPDPEEVQILEQASYNNIVGEMGQALRERNLSPINAFRGVLAAPFRATATFIAPGSNGQPPEYQSVMQSADADLNAAFRLRMRSVWTTPSATWIGGGTIPNAYEVTAGEDRLKATEIEAATDALLTLGVQVEDDLTVFIGLAQEPGDFCPGNIAVPARAAPAAGAAAPGS